MAVLRSPKLLADVLIIPTLSFSHRSGEIVSVFPEIIQTHSAPNFPRSPHHLESLISILEQLGRNRDANKISELLPIFFASLLIEFLLSLGGLDLFHHSVILSNLFVRLERDELE